MTEKLSPMLCRWNTFETLLEEVLTEFADGELNAVQALEAIDVYQAAVTHRGVIILKADESRERSCWEQYERRLAEDNPGRKL